jgi:hypothetical protein
LMRVTEPNTELNRSGGVGMEGKSGGTLRVDIRLWSSLSLRIGWGLFPMQAGSNVSSTREGGVLVDA